MYWGFYNKPKYKRLWLLNYCGFRRQVFLTKTTDIFFFLNANLKAVSEVTLQVGRTHFICLCQLTLSAISCSLGIFETNISEKRL